MRTKSSKNCRKKLRFPTEVRARIVGAVKAGDKPLWPYQCPECGMWHLTSQPHSPDGPPILPGKSGLFA